MISAVTLARLLEPQDFGLVAMVGSVFAFITTFEDLGLSTVTIQRENIDHRQVSTLFWINLIFGVVITLIGIGLGPILAWFFDEPKLFRISLFLAVGFLFTACGAQHRALLTRQMRFDLIAFAEIAGAIIGLTIAIVLALNDAGCWALVAMTLIASLLTTVGFWIACKWTPGPPARDAGLRALLGFGGKLSGANLINCFARNLDNVLIGRFWGAEKLGLYSRAYNLFLIPVNSIVWPIFSVALPMLSKIHDDLLLFKKYFLQTLSVVLFLVAPISLILFVMADEIILVFLGEKWLGSIPIFRFLVISLVFQPIYSSIGLLYVSRGDANGLLKWITFSSTCVVTSFVVGLTYGPTAVAAGYSLCIPILIVIGLPFAFRGTLLTLAETLKTCLPAISAAALAGLLSMVLKSSFGHDLQSWFNLLVLSAVMLSAYLVVVLFVFRQKHFYCSLLRMLFQPRSALDV